MGNWYGSLNNRIDENHMFCDEIKVGTGMTEYWWSDRHAYEVVEVKDQKHIVVRELDHKHTGDSFADNEWELISNESNPCREMAKRGKYWYYVVRVTSDILEDDHIGVDLFLAHNDIDKDELRRRGKITKYHKANVSFGVAEYYYDYEF